MLSNILKLIVMRAMLLKDLYTAEGTDSFQTKVTPDSWITTQLSTVITHNASAAWRTFRVCGRSILWGRFHE